MTVTVMSLRAGRQAVARAAGRAASPRGNPFVLNGVVRTWTIREWNEALVPEAGQWPSGQWPSGRCGPGRRRGLTVS